MLADHGPQVVRSFVMTLVHRSRRDGGLRRVREALRHIGDAQSADGVLEMALTQVSSTLGFRRAALSRVEGGDLVIEQIRIPREQRDAARLEEQVAGRAFPLSALAPERQAIETVAAVVVETPDRASLPRDLGRLLGHAPYVVAPLTRHGEIRWLLHADDGRAGISMGPEDRECLWAFVEGLGYAIESRSARDEQRAQRSRINDVLLAAERAALALGAPGDAAAGVAAPPRTGAATVRSMLTGREVEVLELMARGGTNREIARHLVISEETVKSHVASILRKLDAHTRSEAVSRYLGGAPTRPESRLAVQRVAEGACATEA